MEGEERVGGRGELGERGGAWVEKGKMKVGRGRKVKEEVRQARGKEASVERR